MKGNTVTKTTSAMASCCSVLVISLLVQLTAGASQADNAKRLYDHLINSRGYNRLIRPARNHTETISVEIGMRMVSLIDIDEKNQIMTTSVWFKQVWTDQRLAWNPKKYGDVDQLHVPIEEIWIPDVVLFNNADGNYEVLQPTKAILAPSGKVIWEPPAVLNSSCMMDVKFFPFDEQNCPLMFGSWTYDGNEVDLTHEMWTPEMSKTPREEHFVPRGINMDEFEPSVEFDLLSVPARKTIVYYPDNPVPFPGIFFNMTMRRKPLFYTVNLIIPCCSTTFLTILTFYLPSDSCEKITLCISVLLSVTVFLLLLLEVIPPTSLVLPLIGKYLLFTMILVTASIIVTVMVINVHYRGPRTHTMPEWVEKIFLEKLPRILLMRRPKYDVDTSYRSLVRPTPTNGAKGNGQYNPINTLGTTLNNITGNFSSVLLGTPVRGGGGGSSHHSTLSNPYATVRRPPAAIRHQIEDAIEGVEFIKNHLKTEDSIKKVKEDWKYVAMVLDRIFLWLFTAIAVLGTIAIIFQAPTLYSTQDLLYLPQKHKNASFIVPKKDLV